MTPGERVAGATQAQTVLVVDDHDGFRAGIRRLLERHGYHVVEAADGAQASTQAAAAAPDLVLLDVHLPDVDGFTVATRLRRAGTAATIVLTSTHPAIDYAARLRDSAADAFIDKADLSADAIAAVLARRPAATRP